MTPVSDRATLTWVKGEMTLALAGARTGLAEYVAATDNVASLQRAQRQLHQATGAVKLIGLRSISCVLEEAEQVLLALRAADVDIDLPTASAALQSAFDAIDDALAKRANGQQEELADLWPVYLALGQARHAADIYEADLFFPTAIAKVPTRSSSAQANNDAALESGRIGALRAQFQRGLLSWLSDADPLPGLMLMRAAALAAEARQTKTIQKDFWWIVAVWLATVAEQPTQFDQRMVRSLTARIERQLRHVHAEVSDRLLRAVLYALTQAKQTRLPEAQQIQQAYALTAQAKLLSQETIGQITLPHSASQTDRLKQLSSQLVKLEQALDIFFRDPTQPSVLLPIEPVLQTLASELHALQESQAYALMQEVTHTIHQLLNAGLPGSASKQTMETLAQKISGLGFYLENLQRDGYADFAQALQPLAAAQPVKPTLSLVPQMIERGQSSASLPDDTVPTPATQALVGASAIVIDQELLEIFLQEADEVVQAQETRIAELQRAPDDIQRLTELRRGFHTLKGSGRMVGLTRLGEVAHALEIVMNLWLRQTRPVTPALFDLLAQSQTHFRQWLTSLRTQAAEPDIQTLLQQAQTVGQAELNALGAMMPFSLTTPDMVHIGSVMISAALYQTFLVEAQTKLDLLEHALKTIESSPSGSIQEPMLRAAHTLTGICGTVQMVSMQALAAALEGALSRLAAHRFPITPHTRTQLTEAVQALQLMYAGIRERATPGDAQPLVSALTLIAPQSSATQQQPAAQDDALDTRLLPLFIQESQELAPQLAANLRGWINAPNDRTWAQAIQRILHTLKGSARMTGAFKVAAKIHALESAVELALHEPATAIQFQPLQHASDEIISDLEALAPAEPAVANHAPAGAPEALNVAPAPVPALAPAAMTLRLSSVALDTLINATGEVAVGRARIENDLLNLKAALKELSENVLRMRREVREIDMAAEASLAAHRKPLETQQDDFDPLEFDRYTRLQELSRMLAESVDDVATVQHTLEQISLSAEATLAQQGRTNRQVQHDLLRIRLVPFESATEPLYRLVRQTAAALGREAHLEIKGVQVELDRMVLEQMTAPLQHLLRNAVTHGIEQPAERLRAGKPAVGQIHLEVQQEGNELSIRLRDDGPGLDLQRIRTRAQQLGLLDATSALSASVLSDFIFKPGFSTAQDLSDYAGRGVGMDVVRTTVIALGGRIQVESTAGQGTQFVIRLPLTTAMAQVVLVRAGGQLWGIPTLLIEHVQHVQLTQLTADHEQGGMLWNEQRYALHRLSQLLSIHPVAAARPLRAHPVLFVRSGAESIALEVEEALGQQEVVVKTLGPQLARMPGLTGVTVIGSGDIVFLLNPITLLMHQPKFPPLAGAVAVLPEVTIATSPEVLVVDDSLTVRKITERLLVREGYRVRTARDGAEAIQMIGVQVPSLVLLDIEMPRMDGLEVLRSLRADAALASLPVIMITSRTTGKLREQADALGVQAFLGKPYQEETLLAQIHASVGLGQPTELARPAS